MVSVAASMTDVVRKAAVDFHEVDSRVSIDLNIGGTGQLANQILQGAPVDVLISADPKWIESLASAQAADISTRLSLAGNRLVLIRPADRGLPKSTSVLANADIHRVAIGNPDIVPAGSFARAILQDLHLWEAVRGKLIFGEDVRQVLNYVERGEVDAGMVFATDARGNRMVTVVEGWDLPQRNYEAVVLKASGHPDEARAFVEYLGSDQFQSALKDAGFVVD